MSVALVTGSSSGIGQAAALRIAERGSGVIVTYNKNREGGLETVARIQEAGGTAVALQLDLSLTETFPAFRDGVKEALAENWQTETLTYLANNGGFAQMELFEETTEDLFERLWKVIMRGPYFLTQTLLPLLEDGGAIVNTTSNSALYQGTAIGYSAYGSMKGGLLVLTRYLARELSARGIRVNSVAPGSTRTRIADDAFAKYPEVIPPLAANTALGRIGEADDLGTVIAFLLSDEARWITAQNIEVSGGFNFTL